MSVILLLERYRADRFTSPESGSVLAISLFDSSRYCSLVRLASGVMSLILLLARSSDWRLVRSFSGVRSVMLFRVSLRRARFLHFSKPDRFVMFLVDATRTKTFFRSSSERVVFGSLMASLTAASRFLSSKGPAATEPCSASHPPSKATNTGTMRKRLMPRLLEEHASDA